MTQAAPVPSDSWFRRHPGLTLTVAGVLYAAVLSLRLLPRHAGRRLLDALRPAGGHGGQHVRAAGRHGRRVGRRGAHGAVGGGAGRLHHPDWLGGPHSPVTTAGRALGTGGGPGAAGRDGASPSGGGRAAPPRGNRDQRLTGTGHGGSQMVPRHWPAGERDRECQHRRRGGEARSEASGQVKRRDSAKESPR